MRARVLCLLALCLSLEGFAAKKDFKGLFGSYRREKFTENEARSTDFGMDLMLSTALPITSMANSSEDLARTSPGEPLASAMFFNAEANFFFTLNYHWEIYAMLGYYSYSTRRQNVSTDPTNPEVGSSAGTPLYHSFDMEAIPALLGVKYRFGTSDIVPYIGLAAGVALTKRSAAFDYSPANQTTYNNVLAGHLSVGLEFFISPRTGIRLETAAMYMALPAATFDTGGTPTNFPLIYFQANPIALRYASGLFILF